MLVLDKVLEDETVGEVVVDGWEVVAVVVVGKTLVDKLVVCVVLLVDGCVVVVD